ncbi:MAG: TIGR04083 family peptide-modifying radical SAM enzyme [Anaerolineaceae bacterium]|nr:TIGR04083 family peptide-modifying radical SAM enzyme [Anaerolineaceae bacterium]
MKHLMLVPSKACPASCTYCFGPHEGQRGFSPGVLDDTVEWVAKILPPDPDSRNKQPLDILFHGGEPLMAGKEFYSQALPQIYEGLPHLKLSIGMQSNLWLMDDEIAELFRQYNVDIGTSLDGPEEINNNQRGKGYFRNTMRGIETCRRNGIKVGVISTLTRQSGQHIQKIFDFFAHQGLSVNIHVAVTPFGDSAQHPWEMSPDEQTQVYLEIFEYYFNHLKTSQISSLDGLARSVYNRSPNVCVFSECLGEYFAVGPEGDIYPCQRFVGAETFILGHVSDQPTLEDLKVSPAWKQMADRQEHIREECAGCEHIEYCHGGCPYNALARGSNKGMRDPSCSSYKAVFDYLQKNILDEVFSEENLACVVEKPEQGSHYRRGRIHSLIREDQTPYQYAQDAREICAAAVLGMNLTPEVAAEKLQKAGVLQNAKRSLPGLQYLKRRLTTPAQTYNNFYLHTTFHCQLSCDHCYAKAGCGTNEFFPVDNLYEIALKSADRGFRQFVITGGEPMLHPEFDKLAAAMRRVMRDREEMQTTLRTNLALPLHEEQLKAAAASFERVIVSLDGKEASNDTRRGVGSYRRTLANIKHFLSIAPRRNISLHATLPYSHAKGEDGKHLEQLAADLGIKITFRQLLPLGRADNNRDEIAYNPIWEPGDFEKSVAYQMVRSSCGVGQNLYVEPDGTAFLCYAWKAPQSNLGQVRDAASLVEVLENPAFIQSRALTVDENPKCKHCDLRYLCGGICRAWYTKDRDESFEFNSAPPDCTAFYQRQKDLLLLALDYLEVPVSSWDKVGFNKFS